MKEPMVTAASAPQRNYLLAALSAEARARLYPHLTLVSLRSGAVLQEAGVAALRAYFPVDCVISILCVLENGASTEVAQVGREGVLGATSCLDHSGMSGMATVTSPGLAWSLPAYRLRDEIGRHGELMQLALRHTQSLMTQMAQIAACNRRHPIGRQLCRWLLSTLDRLPGNQLALSHEAIAHLLGVRREGVSEVAAKLQKAGAIEYHHGHVTVLDRAKLEQRSCECYAVVRREVDRLLPNAANAADHWEFDRGIAAALPRRAPQPDAIPA